MKRPTVALIYDFDGTLSPANMQEFGLLQAFDKDPVLFWQKSNKMSTDNDASEILCYMKTMIDEAKKAGIHLTRENFQKFGSMVKLYPGVKEWFGLINDYGRQNGLEVEHYINSSGLTEMIEGTDIYHEFKKVFACSFLYEDGEAVWPGVAEDTVPVQDQQGRDEHQGPYSGQQVRPGERPARSVLEDDLFRRRSHRHPLHEACKGIRRPFDSRVQS